MTYDQWEIAVVPFPFVDNTVRKPRPVLLLSKANFIATTGHSIAAMITSSQHKQWQGDTIVHDLSMAGLAKPSLIRLKLFTLDMRFTPRLIGTLSNHDKERFHQNFVETTF